MADSRFVTALGAAVFLTPVVAMAAPETATYVFGGGGIVCGVNQVGNTCAIPGTEYDLSGTTTSVSAPTLSARGTGTFQGGSDEGVNHFNPGLGVGESSDNASSRIGHLEDLVLTFGENVSLLSFEVASFSGLAQQGELINGISQFFNYANAFGTDGPQNIDIPDVSGEVFTWTNITAEGQGFGYFLHSVTVEFDNPDEPTPVIPVGPALPMLGGALGLLVWRARRGKKSA